MYQFDEKKISFGIFSIKNKDLSSRKYYKKFVKLTLAFFLLKASSMQFINGIGPMPREEYQSKSINVPAKKLVQTTSTKSISRNFYKKYFQYLQTKGRKYMYVLSTVILAGRFQKIMVFWGKIMQA